MRIIKMFKVYRQVVGDLRPVELASLVPVQGDVGPMGDVGEIGDKGIVGLEGFRGPTGPTGEQGPIGDKGLTGPDGLRGPDGEKGDSIQGPDGEQGPVGDIGETGPIGNPGPDGDTGPDGDAGPDGPTGDPGDDGPVGPAGADGVSIPGAKGPTGPKGPRGATGPVGPAGPAGDDGELIFDPVYTSITAQSVTNFQSLPSNFMSWGGRDGIVMGDVSITPAGVTAPMVLAKVMDPAPTSTTPLPHVEEGDTVTLTPTSLTDLLAVMHLVFMPHLHIIINIPITEEVVLSKARNPDLRRVTLSGTGTISALKIVDLEAVIGDSDLVCPNIDSLTVENAKVHINMPQSAHSINTKNSEIYIKYNNGYESTHGLQVICANKTSKVYIEGSYAQFIEVTNADSAHISHSVVDIGLYLFGIKNVYINEIYAENTAAPVEFMMCDTVVINELNAYGVSLYDVKNCMIRDSVFNLAEANPSMPNLGVVRSNVAQGLQIINSVFNSNVNLASPLETFTDTVFGYANLIEFMHDSNVAQPKFVFYGNVVYNRVSVTGTRESHTDTLLGFPLLSYGTPHEILEEFTEYV